MKRTYILMILLVLAALGLADTVPRGHPAPKTPYVKRHSALDRYPFKNAESDQLTWADFGLSGRVRKLYIQTSDIIWEPGALRDHVIARFDSLGQLQTTITYPHSPLPQGFRYFYHPDGQLERVERYAYQDGFDAKTADIDSVSALQGNDAVYFYDELDYLARIVFYDEAGAVNREHVYTYTADGYNIAINYTVQTRRFRDQIYFYDRQGRLVASQKKDTAGKFINTAKFSFDSKNNTVTILQDYLNNAPTQKTLDVFDPAGRLKESTINDPQGNLMRKYSYSYDSAGRLIKLLYNSPNDRITTSYTYKTDALGNLTEFTSTPDKGPGAFSLTIRYEYY